MTLHPTTVLLLADERQRDLERMAARAPRPRPRRARGLRLFRRPTPALPRPT
jgi:hypothetical protein